MKSFYGVVMALCLVSSFASAQGEFSYIESMGVEGLDPITYEPNEVNDRLASLMYSSLFSFDKTPKPVPDMVEKFEAAPGKPNAYILSLRKNMKWADGQEVTIDDVMRSVEVIRNPNTQCSSDQYLQKRLKLFKMEKVDKYRLQVTFSFAYSPSEWQSILRFPVLPKKVIGSLDGLKKQNPLNTVPNGCGPFYFKRYLSDFVDLKKNPDYHRRNDVVNPAPIENITMLSNADDVTRVEQFRSGQADMLIEVPWSKIPDIESQAAQFETRPYEALSYHYLGFNFRKKVFSAIPEVRAAIAKAINRAEILKKIYYDKGQLINGPFPPASPYADPTVPTELYDIAEARKLLAKAGITDKNADGILEYEGQPLKFKLVYSRLKGSKGDANQAACEYIEGNLRQIGIRIEPVPVDNLQLYLDKLFINHDFDLSFGQWRFGDINGDPSSMFISSDTTKELNNYIRYINPKIDELFGTFEKASDDNTRKELGREIHARLAAEHPYVFLWSLNNLTAYNRKKITNISINPYSFFDSIHEWQVKKR